MTGKFNSFGGLGEMPVQEGNTPEPEAAAPKVSALSKKLQLIPLEDLYKTAVEAGKVTPSIKAAILAKEDFSKIQKRYCEVACKLCPDSKRPGQARLHDRPADIVIVQDHNALPDRFKSSEQVEQITRDIVGFLATKYFQGLSFVLLNAVKCVPDEKDLRGAALTATKGAPCSAYLHHEIRKIAPKVVIVLTTNTAKTLGLKKASATTNRGEFHQTEFGPVVITLHPKVLTMIRQNASGKAWGPDYLEVIDRDFHKAARIARGDLKVVSLEEGLAKASKDIWICKDLEEVVGATNLIMAFPETKVISFDLETTSLDAWAEGAKILTAQFGYTEPETGIIKAIVIPLWHRENTWFDPEEAWPYISRILLRNCPKVGHNIKFDIIYTFVKTGDRVVNAAFDTLLLLHAINSGLKGNYSLKKGVWDFLPETGLGGYEDKLPPLTKPKKVKAVEEETEEDDEELPEDA